MMIRLPLESGWKLHLVDGPIPAGLPRNIPATVPGTVHTDLLAAGLIPDPYLDLNERDLQWIGETDVEYSVQFDFDHGGHDRIDLVCEGLDTVADLSLNGAEIGSTRNQHRSYRFDVTGQVSGSANELSVSFASALAFATAAEQRIGVRPVVGNAYPYNAIRKMACNFGWDWGPVLITAGIWKPIRLEAWSTARLATVRPVVTVVDGVGSVEVYVAVERLSGAPLTLDVRIVDPSGRDVAAAGPLDFDGESSVISLMIENPELWWPRGHGEQPLYELLVTLGGESGELGVSRKNIGFRTVAAAAIPDEFGTGFSVSVNGDEIWIKGANWIPDDCFLPRITPERYRASIADAVEADFNLLRVWGGGIYESDDFYDECDRVGLLVWQDFALACAAYSEAPELWDEIEAEARENVVRLSSHPSLAVWNGGNENVEGYYHWGWREALPADASWGNGYYEVLLPSILAELDPGRPYVPSSPFNPVTPSEPRDPDNGTVHEWEVWNRQDYDYYRENVPRFVAEFGFQGPPTMATIERAIHDVPLASDSVGMLWHQKAEDGNGKLDRGLGRHLPRPEGFDDWHFATQLNQARAITFGIEHFRSHFPRTAGSIIWQLNDCWPVSSWAAVDGDKRRKPLWYALRSVNAERLLMLQPREGVPTLVVSNDSDTQWNEIVDVRRIDFSGREIHSQDIGLSIPPRTTRAFELATTIVTPADGASELIVASSTIARTAYWYFAEDVDLRIPSLDIETTVSEVPGGYAVEITAGAFVKDLALAADRLDPAASADQSLLTMLPGERATIMVSTSTVLDASLLVAHPVLNSVNSLLSRSAANRLASP
jgi:beta-mannosidase